MKLELIPAEDIKRIWSLRWAIATAVLAALPIAYATLPEAWEAAIPSWVKAAFAGLTLSAAVGTAVVRVVKQPVKQ